MIWIRCYYLVSTIWSFLCPLPKLFSRAIILQLSFVTMNFFKSQFNANLGALNLGGGDKGSEVMQRILIHSYIHIHI